jgi:hypothetical protein
MNAARPATSLMAVEQKQKYKYINCAMTRWTNPNYTFTLPSAFWRAQHRQLVFREAFVELQNAHSPYSFTIGNSMLHASFVSDGYCDRFVCLCNSLNMKKKVFEYAYQDTEFTIYFTTIDGTRIQPSDYCIDFACRYWDD